MAPTQQARLYVQNDVAGQVVTCSEGLSFWGGVDPDTGVIIDAHHPECGVSLSCRFVLMPTSRGSCSGSGVLLELARAGKAPAALVFREEEDILTLGAMIAERLFECPVAVIRLGPDQYDTVAKAGSATLRGQTLSFAGQDIALEKPDPKALALSAEDRRLLDGQEGAASQIAMEILCRMASVQGAEELIDVTRGHIDGCILAHDANLDFAEKMQQMGAKTRIPTTINAISVDRENWNTQGVVPDFGGKASRLADAYVAMDARPTFTCAPYLLEDVPAKGEAIGWSESNAVIYANSVLGARTQKHPDYLDLFVAMTGRAPNTGVYLAANRVPTCEVRVAVPNQIDDSFWPMLGWLVGAKSPNGIPLITGLERAIPSTDNLKALCAAFGTTSAAPLLHVRGHTPEGVLIPAGWVPIYDVSAVDLVEVWRGFNAGPRNVDLVAIGSPHASLGECRDFARLLAGQQVDTQTIVTLGRDVLASARSEGIIEVLENAGVQVFPDICWCSITEPVFPPAAEVLMTNSGKYAHYADGLTGRAVRFGSLADCAEVAVSGQARAKPPKWLVQS